MPAQGQPSFRNLEALNESTAQGPTEQKNDCDSSSNDGASEYLCSSVAVISPQRTAQVDAPATTPTAVRGNDNFAAAGMTRRDSENELVTYENILNDLIL